MYLLGNVGMFEVNSEEVVGDWQSLEKRAFSTGPFDTMSSRTCQKHHILCQNHRFDTKHDIFDES